MKPLFMPPAGDYLFQSTRENTVDVWRVGDGLYLATCPGSLVGASSDGKVLLTSTPAGTKAWQAETGLELDPLSLDPAQFEFHQRHHVLANRFKLTLELHDALGLEELQTVRIDHDLRYFPNLDAWELAPDNTSLAVTLSGEVVGEDWASGVCIDLGSGARRFKFKVNKYQTHPVINFSREHNLLLVSDDIYHLAMYDLASGKVAREAWVSGFSNVISVTASNPWLVAVNVWEPSASRVVSPFSVQILNLERALGGHTQRAAVEAILVEPRAVVDLLCAPDGVHLASLLSDGTIHWWNLGSLRLERSFELSLAS